MLLFNKDSCYVFCYLLCLPPLPPPPPTLLYCNYLIFFVRRSSQSQAEAARIKACGGANYPYRVCGVRNDKEVRVSNVGVGGAGGGVGGRTYRKVQKPPL